MNWTIEVIRHNHPVQLPPTWCDRIVTRGVAPLILELVEFEFETVPIVTTTRTRSDAGWTRFATTEVLVRYYLIAESRRRRFAAYLPGTDPVRHLVAGHDHPVAHGLYVNARDVDALLAFRLARPPLTARLPWARRYLDTTLSREVDFAARYGNAAAYRSSLREPGVNEIGIDRGPSHQFEAPTPQPNPNRAGYVPEWAEPLARRR